MKKLLFTVTNDLSFDQRMKRICGTLARAGYAVKLIGRELPGSLPLRDEPFEQKRFKLIFHKGKFFYLEYNLRLLLHLMNASFDAVCPVDLDTLVPCFLVGKWRRKPIVFDSHEYFTEVPEVVDRPITKWVWETVAQTIVPKLKHAYTVSGCLAKVFEERYGIPFTVIRNLPLSKPLPPENPSLGDPFILIYQGVLNQGRGLEEMVTCLKKMNGVVLWIAGEGDLSQKIRQLVSSMGLNDRVVFFGKIPPDELHDLTAKAHLGLNLLENKGLSYYYSLANKTFDYMQAGIPCVCMDFPEYKGLVKKTKAAILLNDLDPYMLTRTICCFRDNAKDYLLLRGNTRKAANEWIWEKEEPKLLAFYSGIWTDLS